MPTFIVSGPIRTHVLPIYCVALDRLEDYTFLISATLGITFQESAPLFPVWPLNPRKVCSTSCTITAQPNHEAADPAPRSACTGPVVVVCIMAIRTVALCPQLLNEDERAPSLESTRARFYALYSVRPRNWCFARMANLGVQAFLSRGPDRRGLEEGVADGL
jgi:hypothetical protein